MDDFLEKKPKKHSDAALATAARFSWVHRAEPAPRGPYIIYISYVA